MAIRAKAFTPTTDAASTVGDPPVPGLVKGTGKEIGGRVQFGEFNFTATYWWLENEGELIFVGNSNSVEPKGAASATVTSSCCSGGRIEWLAIDAVYAGTHGRFKDSPGADYIPNAPEAAGELGVAAIFDDYEASMRVRYHGAFPLTEDNSEREDGHAWSISASHGHPDRGRFRPNC